MKVAYEHPSLPITIFSEQGNIINDPLARVEFFGGSFVVDPHTLPRERARCFTLRAIGLTTPEIEDTIMRSDNTIKTNVKHAMATLGCNSMAQGVGRAFETGLFRVIRFADPDEHSFTPRQVEVLAAAERGLSCEASGSVMGLVQETVKTHRHHMNSRMNVDSARIPTKVLLANMVGELMRPEVLAEPLLTEPALPPDAGEEWLLSADQFLLQ